MLRVVAAVALRAPVAPGAGLAARGVYRPAVAAVFAQGARPTTRFGARAAGKTPRRAIGAVHACFATGSCAKGTRRALGARTRRDQRVAVAEPPARARRTHGAALVPVRALGAKMARRLERRAFHYSSFAT